MKKKTLPLILACAWAIHCHAQVSPGSGILDVGNYTARVHADGECFRSNSGSQPAFEWPKGSGNHAAFCYNVWIGGLDETGALHMAGQTYRQGGRDFFAGPLSDTLEYDSTSYILKWRKVWPVYAAQIDSFRTHFAMGAVDFSKYPTIQTWPAHGDTSKGQLADIAPFVDVDLDGRYDPAGDGDYPEISGDQAVFFIFNDHAAPHGETGGRAFPLEVHGMAYGFSCADSGFSDVMFLHYEVFNLGDTNYHGMILGAWLDADIGQFDDDFVGTDATRGLFFSYNGDSLDGDYGLNPPATGGMFLGQPLRSMMYYQNDFTSIGNPFTDMDHYSYLKATWLDGTHLVDNGTNGHESSGGPGPDINYFCPGDAGWCGGSTSGWTEFSAGNLPFDRRQVAAVEPFSLDAGDVKVFDLAIMVARGFYNKQLGSVCELQQLADRVNVAWGTALTPCGDSILLSTPAFPQFSDHKDWLVHPNPSEGMIQLDWQGDAQTVMLTDLAGRVLLSHAPRAGQRSLQWDLSGKPAGMYLMVLQREGNVATKRVVIR